MAKKICALCGKEMGALSMKTEIKDGVICLDCFGIASKLAKIKAGKFKEHSTASLKEIIDNARNNQPAAVAPIEPTTSPVEVVASAPNAPLNEVVPLAAVVSSVATSPPVEVTPAPVIDTRDKSKCAVCEKPFGKLSLKIDLMDGFICLDCMNRAKIKQKHSKEYDTASIVELAKQNVPQFFENKAREDLFNVTKKIDKFLHIDENNKLFRLGKDGFILNFGDLVAYELLEDNESITSGGLGSAVVGGLLAGGTGAAVGAVIGGKKSKSTCESLDIKLTVKHFFSDVMYIHFIGWIEKGCKTDSIHYQFANDNAQKCLSALMLIMEENKAAAGVAAPAPAVDVAAELEKFHALMEKGIITQDEFNAKKSQLLGL